MKSINTAILKEVKKTFNISLGLDIRTRLYICIVFTFFAVMCQQLNSLLIIFFCVLFTNFIFRTKLNSRALKNLFIMVFMVAVFQTLFYREGPAVISFCGIKLFTYPGLEYALRLLLRTYILFFISMLIVSADRGELIAGLSRMKIPFEIIFMLQLASRFFPLFIDKFKTTIYAMQLRGVNFKKIYLPKTIKAIFKLIVPVTVNALQGAENLSITAETRGFRYKTYRTVYRDINLRMIDWICIICVSVVSICFMIFLV